MKSPPILHGLRREMTKEVFEELVSLQCEPDEILGYIGTTEEKLDSWCRRAYKRHPLDDMIRMIRQDGLIAIRWARLYGGAVAVIVVRDGTGDLSLPLDPDRLTPGCFRGLLVLPPGRPGYRL